MSHPGIVLKIEWRGQPLLLADSAFLHYIVRYAGPDSDGFHELFPGQMAHQVSYDQGGHAPVLSAPAFPGAPMSVFTRPAPDQLLGLVVSARAVMTGPSPTDDDDDGDMAKHECCCGCND